MNAPNPPSSYAFYFEGGNDNVYAFTTALSIVYRVRFKPTPYFFSKEWVFHTDVVEMVIAVADNPTDRRPPLDRAIPPTIAAVVLDFFERHRRAITIYICDTSDGRHSSRNRKFNEWFDLFNPNMLLKVNYSIRDDSDGLNYHIALFTSVRNPQLPAIMAEFQRISEGYNDPK